MNFRPSSLPSRRPNGAPPQITRTPSAPKQVPVPEASAAVGVSPSEAISSALTAEELISRAKQHIGVGETSRISSFRAAADDIALACDKGAKQREVARALGKSVAWVNRLLKWRKGRYVGAPFADKVVQGVNNDDSPPEATPSEAPGNPTVLSEPRSDGAAPSQAESAVPSAITQMDPALTNATTDDYHLPQALNRRDPNQAFQQLAAEWRSSPFRHLLLDSPRAAQLRFLSDVLLPELGGLEVIGSSERNIG